MKIFEESYTHSFYLNINEHYQLNNNMFYGKRIRFNTLIKSLEIINRNLLQENVVLSVFHFCKIDVKNNEKLSYIVTVF